MKYIFVSFIGYLSVFFVSNFLTKTSLLSNEIYTLSYILIYVFDYLTTCLLVFEKRVNFKGISRFIIITFLYLIVGNAIFTINLELFTRIPAAVILTGLILSPSRYLISKNYVYSKDNSLLSGLKHCLGDVCRFISFILNKFDKKGLMRKRSNSNLLTWLKSLLGFENAQLLIDLDLPWWPFSVENYLRDFLKSTPNAKVFEWGSGASTFWLSKRATSVVSIEHDKDWSNTVQNLLNQGGITNTNLIYVPAEKSISPKVPSSKSGAQNLDFFNYVNKISDFGEFDLIVVDGRARNSCLNIGIEHLKPNGILLLDNSNRKRYRVNSPKMKKIEFKGLTPASPWKTHSMIYFKSKHT